jgi:hypothetical protein
MAVANERRVHQSGDPARTSPLIVSWLGADGVALEADVDMSTIRTLDGEIARRREIQDELRVTNS